MNEDRERDQKRLEGFFRDELRAAEAEAPSFDELAAYVEGRLSVAESTELAERIAGDETLQREVELLRELRGELARPARPASARRIWTWAGLAAAAAVAAMASWMLLRQGQGAAGLGPDARSEVLVASLRDGNQTVGLSKEGAVLGLSGIDPEMREAVGAALRGALAAPTGLSDLRPERSALMGQPREAPAFAPQAPVGTRVSTAQPTFRWSRHPDATAYDVKVFDQDFQVLAAGTDVRGTEWQAPRPLAVGRIYIWQVTARTGHDRVSAPAAPQPEARFEVASEALLAEVARRRRGAPTSHLVAALAFLEAGLLDDADLELQALGAANPGAALVTALRDRVRGMMR